jgi:spermidine/putrescine transport system permease protein
MATGIVLVFVPAVGQFVIPDLLGGSKTVLLGNVIQQQFGASQNWPFGSAIAAVAMGVVLLTLWLYSRAAQQVELPALRPVASQREATHQPDGSES